MSRPPMTRPAAGAPRPTLRALAPVLAASLLLGGCTGGGSVGTRSTSAGPTGATAPAQGPLGAVAAAPEAPVVLPARTASAMSVAASRAVWRSSPVAVTTDMASLDEAARQAADLRVPLLVLESRGAPDASPPASPNPDASPPASGDPVTDPAAELARLGVTDVLHVGADAPSLPGIHVVTDAGDLPDLAPGTPAEGVTAVTTPRAAAAPLAAVATAVLAAAGVPALALTSTDPRSSDANLTALSTVDPSRVIGIGRGFGPRERFAQRVAAAATGVRLPGGGQKVFAGKRYVALYGHPLSAALGALGEQDPRASVARARAQAAQYEPHVAEKVIPAFEIIATVASGSKGKDGNYSNEWSIDTLRPLVRAASESGLYVVLDLQSGRADFLSQAKRYEELLRLPNVGLAMDPEWRLTPEQHPMEQIGSVSAAELNEAMDWLARLTAENHLPQKMVLLHQFRTDMITERETLDLTHDELAVVLQMDGDGTLGQKQDTWNALLADAPRGLRFGWKNFYDEDEPTPSPGTTMRQRPTPWWVSYQ